jgi:hypothetical protein
VNPIPGLAAAAAATIVVPPIHGPLGQMGFSEEHITMAIIALRVRHDDLSATTINQCATWMIDHPVPSAVRNAEHLTARRNAPRQFTHPRLLRENAATNDIRNFFRHRLRHETMDEDFDLEIPNTSEEEEFGTTGAGAAATSTGEPWESVLSAAYGLGGEWSSESVNVITRGTRRLDPSQSSCQG